MRFRYHYHVMPFVAGERGQTIKLGQTFGGNAHIGFAGQDPFGNMLGRALL